MSEDAPKKRRHQTNTDRDLEGLEARAQRERERLEHRATDRLPSDLATGEVPGESSSEDGVPEETDAEFDALTPPPFDLTENPEFAALAEVWDHSNKNYKRSVNKILKGLKAAGASPEVAKHVAAHGAQLARIRIMVRVAQIIGGVLIAVCAIVGGVALKAIYGSGMDRGSVTETLRIHERDIEHNRDAVDELRKDLDKADQAWRNAMFEFERDHNGSRRGRSSPTPSADVPSTDTTPGGDPP